MHGVLYKLKKRIGANRESLPSNKKLRLNSKKLKDITFQHSNFKTHNTTVKLLYCQFVFLFIWCFGTITFLWHVDTTLLILFLTLQFHTRSTFLDAGNPIEIVSKPFTTKTRKVRVVFSSILVKRRTISTILLPLFFFLFFLSHLLNFFFSLLEPELIPCRHIIHTVRHLFQRFFWKTRSKGRNLFNLLWSLSLQPSGLTQLIYSTFIELLGVMWLIWFFILLKVMSWSRQSFNHILSAFYHMLWFFENGGFESALKFKFLMILLNNLAFFHISGWNFIL